MVGKKISQRQAKEVRIKKKETEDDSNKES
jgi:hypothetical protein